APGSQKWKGNWADFVNAPNSTSTRAGATVGPVGGPPGSPDREEVPADWASNTNPASMARPPRVVTNRAWRAAERATPSSSSNPINRYEAIEVSSQNR